MSFYQGKFSPFDQLEMVHRSFCLQKVYYTFSNSLDWDFSFMQEPGHLAAVLRMYLGIRRLLKVANVGMRIV